MLLCIDSKFGPCHSERTHALLTNAAYVHLKHFDVSKHTRNLSPASRAILLSGPAGMVNWWSKTHCTSFSFPEKFQVVISSESLTNVDVVWSVEFYQQALARALAHHFEAKLLLLDLNDFSLKVICVSCHSLQMLFLVLTHLYTDVYFVRSITCRCRASMAVPRTR